jgi:hypothetical protein
MRSSEYAWVVCSRRNWRSVSRQLVTLLAHELVAEAEHRTGDAHHVVGQSLAMVLPSDASGSQCAGLAAACAVGACAGESLRACRGRVMDDGGIVKMMPPLPSDLARPLSTSSRIIFCADDTTSRVV